MHNLQPITDAQRVAGGSATASSKKPRGRSFRPKQRKPPQASPTTIKPAPQPQHDDPPSKPGDQAVREAATSGSSRAVSNPTAAADARASGSSDASTIPVPNAFNGKHHVPEPRMAAPLMANIAPRPPPISSQHPRTAGGTPSAGDEDDTSPTPVPTPLPRPAGINRPIQNGDSSGSQGGLAPPTSRIRQPSLLSAMPAPSGGMRLGGAASDGARIPRLSPVSSGGFKTGEGVSRSSLLRPGSSFTASPGSSLRTSTVAGSDAGGTANQAGNAGSRGGKPSEELEGSVSTQGQRGGSPAKRKVKGKEQLRELTAEEVSTMKIAEFCTSYKSRLPPKPREKGAKEKAAKAANAASKRKRALADAGGAPAPPPQSMKVVFKDGKLVVNDADLIVQGSSSIDDENREEVDEDETTAATASSFTNRETPMRWKPHDVIKFYRGIQMYSLSFDMMVKMFNGERSQKQLKKKYEKELREHPEMVHRALRTQINKDHPYFSDDPPQLPDFKLEDPKRKEANRPKISTSDTGGTAAASATGAQGAAGDNTDKTAPAPIPDVDTNASSPRRTSKRRRTGDTSGSATASQDAASDPKPKKRARARPSAAGGSSAGGSSATAGKRKGNKGRRDSNGDTRSARTSRRTARDRPFGSRSARGADATASEQRIEEGKDDEDEEDTSDGGGDGSSSLSKAVKAPAVGGYGSVHGSGSVQDGGNARGSTSSGSSSRSPRRSSDVSGANVSSRGDDDESAGGSPLGPRSLPGPASPKLF